MKRPKWNGADEIERIAGARNAHSQRLNGDLLQHQWITVGVRFDAFAILYFFFFFAFAIYD